MKFKNKSDIVKFADEVLKHTDVRPEIIVISDIEYQDILEADPKNIASRYIPVVQHVTGSIKILSNYQKQVLDEVERQKNAN